MSVWVILGALAMAAVIGWLGLTALRAASGAVPPRRRADAEDVEELEVFLLCGECGTEFRVTRLGELQIPRHCGEPMQVAHRPAAT